SDRTKWEIPQGVTIPAQRYLVIWADDEEIQGALHASFKLSAGGESVGLFDRVGNQLAQIDAITFGAQTESVAEGRSPDGAECIAFFDPSPLAPNPNGPADLTGDGVLNFFDVSAFLSAFSAQD